MSTSNNFFVELNGVANIKILLDDLVKESPNNDEILVPATQIYMELETLERYMLAVAEAARNGDQPPYWHEVKADKQKYPKARR